MIRIYSHPSMSTALNPGHKATNQIDKYDVHDLAVLGCNDAISSLCNVHLYGFV